MKGGSKFWPPPLPRLPPVSVEPPAEVPPPALVPPVLTPPDEVPPAAAPPSPDEEPPELLPPEVEPPEPKVEPPLPVLAPSADEAPVPFVPPLSSPPLATVPPEAKPSVAGAAPLPTEPVSSGLQENAALHNTSVVSKAARAPQARCHVRDSQPDRAVREEDREKQAKREIILIGSVCMVWSVGDFGRFVPHISLETAFYEPRKRLLCRAAAAQEAWRHSVPALGLHRKRRGPTRHCPLIRALDCTRNNWGRRWHRTSRPPRVLREAGCGSHRRRSL